MSYITKDFMLSKHDSNYRQNVLMDMAHFEERYRKFIKDIKSHNEDGYVVITYYIEYE